MTKTIKVTRPYSHYLRQLRKVIPLKIITPKGTRKIMEFGDCAVFEVKDE